jgi:hypothetical protein
MPQIRYTATQLINNQFNTPSQYPNVTLTLTPVLISTT